jgi:SAM-dependent methyltransferase
MSNILSESGFDMTATDPAPREPLKYNVQQMNGYDIKFEDSSFDIILSSNVLEHIDDLPKAFTEMKRVLKPGGVMIHSVPTVYCNLATMIVQPLAYFKNLFLLFSGKAKIKVNKNRSKLFQVLHYWYKIVFNFINPLRILISKGHGVSRNRFWALYIWRRAYWKEKFNNSDLEIETVVKVPYLFSMHQVFPFRMDKFRHKIGNKYNSVDIYCLKNRQNRCSMN